MAGGEQRGKPQRRTRYCGVCGAPYEVFVKFYRVDFSVFCPACDPNNNGAQARAYATLAVNWALDAEYHAHNVYRPKHPLWGKRFR